MMGNFSVKYTVSRPRTVVEQAVQDMCKRYGPDSQIDVCIEEMSELTKALIKDRRSKLYTREANFDGRTEVLEELADVYFMLEYIQFIFQIGSDEIYRKVLDKAKRTLHRYLMEDENEKNTDSE